MYKKLYLIHDSHFPFPRKMYIRLLVRCHLCPIWPPVLPLNTIYILIILPPLSWAKPASYSLLTFHVPELMSMFSSLGHLSKESVQVRRPLWHFVTSLFFTVKSCLAPRLTPKLERHFHLMPMLIPPTHFIKWCLTQRRSLPSFTYYFFPFSSLPHTDPFVYSWSNFRDSDRGGSPNVSTEIK
jgi:hypothetical protein